MNLSAYADIFIEKIKHERITIFGVCVLRDYSRTDIF